MEKALRKACVVGAVALGLVLATASPALAYNNFSDIGGICGGGWAGSSWFNSGNGISYASTTRSGSGCGIEVAIKTYQGQSNHVVGGSATYVSTSKVDIQSGGYHWLGVFTRST
jgi:hypothetical protein